MKLAPDFAPARHLKGIMLQQSGDLDGALALNPKIAEGYNTRGWIRLQKKELDAAIADFDQALALQPALLLARGNRANALILKNDHARARRSGSDRRGLAQ